MNKKFSIITLGCKVNDYESTYTKKLLENDFCYVDYQKEKPDIIIVYSCVVTNAAESKTRKMINHALKVNPDALIVVCGCYSQLKGDELIDNPNIKIVVGSYQKSHILEYIKKYYETNEKILANEIPKKINFEEMYINDYDTKTRAFLKIQDGCNQFCTFCAIPFARGRERSAKLENVVKEALNLVNNSKEIVLTGIHTGKYFDGENNLYNLLKELVKIDGLERIRLSSIEINEITDEIIELFIENKKLARHLHIPIQSCCDTILKSMNRPYDVKYFKERIKYIREKIPNISISTDLIVGFPGESQELFNETFENLCELNFSFIHTFPYSLKSGTKASTFKNQVHGEDKKQRVHRIIAFSDDSKAKFEKSLIGKKARVLIEYFDGKYSIGHISEYALVYIEEKLSHNSMYDIELICYEDKKLIGKLI